MQNYEFLNCIMEPAFVVDVKTSAICCVNGSFAAFFPKMMEEDGTFAFLQPLINKVMHYMRELDASVFPYTLLFGANKKDITVRCQFSGIPKEQIIVVLDVDTNKTILPLESDITAQLIPGGILIIEVRENQYYVNSAVMVTP